MSRVYIICTCSYRKTQLLKHCTVQEDQRNIFFFPVCTFKRRGQEKVFNWKENEPIKGKYLPYIGKLSLEHSDGGVIFCDRVNANVANNGKLFVVN